MSSLLNVFIRRFPRGFKTTSILQQPRSLVKLKKLQADYQCEDGRPVWLKGGLCDRILYSSTLIGCIVGLAMIFATIYDNAKPASWRTPVC